MRAEAASNVAASDTSTADMAASTGWCRVPRPMKSRYALGDGPPDGVDDEGESHFRDLAHRLDRSVRGASSGLRLDFLGHGLPHVRAGAWRSGLASEWQPGELAESDEKAHDSPGRHDQQ